MKIRQISKNLKENIFSEIRIILAYIKINVISAAELRTSFIMQVLGMMLNNVTFVVVWWLFLDAFGSINGWTGKEVIALQGFFAIVFGISFSLFYGVDELRKIVNNGVFDSILLTPRNLYARILTLATRTSAIGDVLFGLVMIGIYIHITHQTFLQSLMLALFLFPAIIILTNFVFIGSCLSFFLPDSEELSRFTFEALVSPSMYPAGVYQGAVRVFFLLVLPAMAMGGLPVEASKDLNIWSLIGVWVLAILWILIANWVLKKGLKRYESGNLTGARL